MECGEARKKLKDYAAGAMPGKEERASLEAHVALCPVCKKELLLWQDVLDRQAAVRGLQRNLPEELRQRLKYRAAILQKVAMQPPLMNRLKAISRMWESPTGRLLIQIFFLMAF